MYVVQGVEGGRGGAATIMVLIGVDGGWEQSVICRFSLFLEGVGEWFGTKPLQKARDENTGK